MKSHPAILIDRVEALAWVKLIEPRTDVPDRPRIEQIPTERCDPKATVGDHGFYEYVERKWRFRRSDVQPVKKVEEAV